jgi:hypothetical protein
MRLRLSSLLASVVAVITLIGLLSGEGVFATLSALFVQIVVITAALTILLGVLNLLSVHFGRVTGRKGGFFYSLILLISFLAVIILTIIERSGTPPPAGERPLSMILLETVQVSIESALAGLLVFALVYGAYRMMRRRVTWTGLLFIVVLLLVLLGELSERGLLSLPLLESARAWLSSVAVSAGARGILLGIALATIVAGVRVLMGQDRSQ